MAFVDKQSGSKLKIGAYKNQGEKQNNFQTFLVCQGKYFLSGFKFEIVLKEQMFKINSFKIYKTSQNVLELFKYRKK